MGLSGRGGVFPFLRRRECSGAATTPAAAAKCRPLSARSPQVGSQTFGDVLCDLMGCDDRGVNDHFVHESGVFEYQSQFRMSVLVPLQLGFVSFVPTLYPRPRHPALDDPSARVRVRVQRLVPGQGVAPQGELLPASTGKDRGRVSADLGVRVRRRPRRWRGMLPVVPGT